MSLSSLICNILLSLHFEKEEEASLKKMLDAGVIVESNSEYAHPKCLVQKKMASST